MKVEYEIPAGTFLGITGPSGGGKTTFLRCLAGFITPDKGIIRHGDSLWFDSSSKKNLPVQKRNVGMVFQEPVLFPHRTLQGNLMYALEDESRAAFLLKMVQLAGWEKYRPHQLSGGQRQRAALAIALMREPSILLLDEPFSSLDDDLRQDLGRQLRLLHDNLGLTTVLVSHHKQEVRALSDRIMTIHSGLFKVSGQ